MLQSSRIRCSLAFLHAKAHAKPHRTWAKTLKNRISRFPTNLCVATARLLCATGAWVSPLTLGGCLAPARLGCAKNVPVARSNYSCERRPWDVFPAPKLSRACATRSGCVQLALRGAHGCWLKPGAVPISVSLEYRFGTLFRGF